jgi:chemotaxis protein MotB
MARKKDGGHGGGHGWFVTFADLMGLLVAFFVMLAASSTQNQQKLEAIAGSMRDAFGVQKNVRYSGVVEVAGLPTRSQLRNAARIPPEESSATPSAQERDRERTAEAQTKQSRAFSLASASLRQALQNNPEIAELSKQVVIEESKEGLNVEIVDQDGRSMFPEGSKEPYERTRRLIETLSVALRDAPYRLSITGHSAAAKTPPHRGYGPWDLSADRANAVRGILQDQGVPPGNFMRISGEADTRPLFPEDPYIAANRRVTITLMREEPPMPLDFQP